MPTNPPQPSSAPLEISDGMQELIREAQDTSFECGYWRSDDEETYDDVYDRSQIAKTALITAIAALEAQRAWWQAEAHDTLLALCREDTYVIERVTRRLLILRSDGGRNTDKNDEATATYLKAVEARVTSSPPPQAT